MIVNLTEKQRFVITDLKDQEQLCMDKYEKGAQMAKDPVLKDLFSAIRQEEQQHYDSLDKLLHGECVAVDTKDKAGQNYEPKATYSGSFMQADKENDKYLCTDAITTEKYVSSAYDFNLFQFADPNIRRLLNDMETEEQNHAEMIYKYKTVNQMI